MGEEAVISKGMRACSHGGVYSVNPRLVQLDCSSSINPLGTPRKAIAAIKMNANSLARNYPDPECRELKKSLSRYLGIDPEWISVGKWSDRSYLLVCTGSICKRARSYPSTNFL